MYREDYATYYGNHALQESPKMRDANPTVVLVPGVGMFCFGKNKAESRITGEFYLNAIHVMNGAGQLGEGNCPAVLPQSGPAADTSAFATKKTTSRCHHRRLFALSTGHLKRPRFSASRRKRN